MTGVRDYYVVGRGGVGGNCIGELRAKLVYACSGVSREDYESVKRDAETEGIGRFGYWLRGRFVGI